MLVLSRAVNEVIYIGDTIRITVVRLAGDKVRLGIDAPPGVAVHREEIYERIKQQEKAQQEHEHTQASGVLPAVEKQAD